MNRLYATVTRDERHRDVTLLEYAEIAERRFGGWRMGKVALDRVNAAVILKYAERPRLDPYSISGGTALRLLEELIESASIVGGG